MVHYLAGLTQVQSAQVQEAVSQYGTYINWVHGIVVDSKGAVYAADTYGQRIQKFVPPAVAGSR